MALFTNNNSGFSPIAMSSCITDSSGFSRIMSVMGKPKEMSFDEISPVNVVPYYNSKYLDDQSLFGLSSEITHNHETKTAEVWFRADSSCPYKGIYSFYNDMKKIDPYWLYSQGLNFQYIAIGNVFYPVTLTVVGVSVKASIPTLYNDDISGYTAYLYASKTADLVVEYVADWSEYNVSPRASSAWSSVNIDVMNANGNEMVSFWEHDLNATGLNVEYNTERGSVTWLSRVAMAFNHFGNNTDLLNVCFTVNISNVRIQFKLYYSLHEFPCEVVSDYVWHPGQAILADNLSRRSAKMCYITLPIEFRMGSSDLNVDLVHCAFAFCDNNYKAKLYPTYAMSAYANSWESSGYSETSLQDYDTVPFLRTEGYYGRHAMVLLHDFSNSTSMDVSDVKLVIPCRKKMGNGLFTSVSTVGSQVLFDFSLFKKDVYEGLTERINTSLEEMDFSSFYSVKNESIVYRNVKQVSVVPIIVNRDADLSQPINLLYKDNALYIEKVVRSVSTLNGVSGGVFYTSTGSYIPSDSLSVKHNGLIYDFYMTGISLILVRHSVITYKSYSCYSDSVAELGNAYIRDGNVCYTIEGDEYTCTYDSISYQSGNASINIPAGISLSIVEFNNNQSYLGAIDSFVNGRISFNGSASGWGLFRVNDCYFSGYTSGNEIDIDKVIFGNVNDVREKEEIFNLSMIIVDRSIADVNASQYYYTGRYVDSLKLPLLPVKDLIIYNVEVVYE